MQVNNTVEVWKQRTSYSSFMCHFCSKTFGQKIIDLPFGYLWQQVPWSVVTSLPQYLDTTLAPNIVIVHIPKENLYCSHCAIVK